MSFYFRVIADIILMLIFMEFNWNNILTIKMVHALYLFVYQKTYIAMLSLMLLQCFTTWLMCLVQQGSKIQSIVLYFWNIKQMEAILFFVFHLFIYSFFFFTLGECQQRISPVWPQFMHVGINLNILKTQAGKRALHFNIGVEFTLQRNKV